jgi:Fe-S oxidoreductase
MHPIHTLEDRRDFIARCTRCSQCKFVAVPQSQRHASACPSMDYGELHAYSGGGQGIMGYAILDGKATFSREAVHAISSCTMCGHCDASCKINFGETVEPLDSLYALRGAMVKGGHSPAPHRTMVDHLRRHGNAAGHPREERLRWADGLAGLFTHGRPDVLVHVGSTLAYDSTRWAPLRGVLAGLAGAGIALAHLGDQEGPSGGTAFDLGYVDEARAFAEAMMAAVKRSAAGTLVTFSAPALAAFRGVYPRFGLDFRQVQVLHITEYVQQLVDQGRLRLHRPATLGDGAVAYHDPCKLGRLSEPYRPHDPGLERHLHGIMCSREPAAVRFYNDGCYDAPRALLRAMGLDVVELERHRASSYCCGACGGVQETVPEAAALAAQQRWSEMEGLPTGTLVSGCSGCSRHLGRHAAGRGSVVDLLALLAEALQPAAVAA